MSTGAYCQRIRHVRNCLLAFIFACQFTGYALPNLKSPKFLDYAHNNTSPSISGGNKFHKDMLIVQTSEDYIVEILPSNTMQLGPHQWIFVRICTKPVNNSITTSEGGTMSSYVAAQLSHSSCILSGEERKSFGRDAKLLLFMDNILVLEYRPSSDNFNLPSHFLDVENLRLSFSKSKSTIILAWNPTEMSKLGGTMYIHIGKISNTSSLQKDGVTSIQQMIRNYGSETISDQNMEDSRVLKQVNVSFASHPLGLTLGIDKPLPYVIFNPVGALSVKPASSNFVLVKKANSKKVLAYIAQFDIGVKQEPPSADSIDDIMNECVMKNRADQQQHLDKNSANVVKTSTSLDSLLHQNEPLNRTIVFVTFPGEVISISCVHEGKRSLVKLKFVVDQEVWQNVTVTETQRSYRKNANRIYEIRAKLKASNVTWKNITLSGSLLHPNSSDQLTAVKCGNNHSFNKVSSETLLENMYFAIVSREDYNELLLHLASARPDLSVFIKTWRRALLSANLPELETYEISPERMFYPRFSYTFHQYEPSIFSMLTTRLVTGIVIIILLSLCITIFLYYFNKNRSMSVAMQRLAPTNSDGETAGGDASIPKKRDLYPMNSIQCDNGTMATRSAS